MEYLLKNQSLTVKFKTIGGTLSSIKDLDGVEYRWQGDQAYWGGQAPVLFPICGSLRDDRAEIGGDQSTHMPRHGIVRKKEFLCEQSNSRKLWNRDNAVFNRGTPGVSLPSFSR